MRAPKDPFAPKRIPSLPKTKNTQMPGLPRPNPIMPPMPKQMPPPMATPVPQASIPSPNDISQGRLQKGPFIPKGGM